MTTQNSELDYELDKAKDKAQKTERYLNDALNKLHNAQPTPATTTANENKQQRDDVVANKASITDKQVLAGHPPHSPSVSLEI